METTLPLTTSHTAFADLDLLLAETEQDFSQALFVPTPDDDAPEPDTVDAFNSQILAGLVSP